MFIITMGKFQKGEPAYKASTCCLMPSDDTLENNNMRILVVAILGCATFALLAKVIMVYLFSYASSSTLHPRQ